MLTLIASRALVCRRCGSVAVAATSSSTSVLARQHASPPLPLLAGCQRSAAPRLGGHQQRRGYLTDRVRAWLAEGPEAINAPAPPAAGPTPQVATGAGVEGEPASSSSFFIEDAPVSLQELLEGSADALANAAEPTFASLGLGTGLWPSNLQLKLLEAMHVTLDSPWWLCAVLLGVCVRLLLVYPSMRLQSLMRSDVPKLRMVLDVSEQMKFAARSGNMMESMRLQQLVCEQFPELTSHSRSRRFMRRFLITIGGNFFAMTFVQLASIRAIYRATALPVESFQLGGALWLTDLTCIDPYFILPAAITSLLMLNVQYSFKSTMASNEQLQQMKPLVYTLLPVVVFTVLINFPGANLYYFFATGCTAQLLHRINTTEAGKEFWKRKVGLPRIEDLPRNAAPQTSKATERIRNEIMPALSNRDYQAMRIADPAGDGQIPKTFRIRQGQKQKIGSG